MISLNNFLSSLNSGIKAGHPFFKCSHTKYTVRLIAVLVKKNYLLGYRRCHEDSTKLIVFFKVAFDRPKPLMLLCRKMSKQPCYIRVKSMKNLQSGSSLWILATTRGILTAQEAWFYRVGGVILCQVR